ncbi:hypothetical protein [Desulfobulbus propionicus]
MPSKATVRGAVPAATLVLINAVGSRSFLPESLEESGEGLKAKGAEWGLSVPSTKVAVRVKLVGVLVMATVQSMAVALGSSA